GRNRPARRPGGDLALGLLRLAVATLPGHPLASRARPAADRHGPAPPDVRQRRRLAHAGARPGCPPCRPGGGDAGGQDQPDGRERGQRHGLCLADPWQPRRRSAGGALPGLGRRALPGRGAGGADDRPFRPARTHLQAPLQGGHRHGAAGVRAHAAAGRSQAAAGVRRCPGRGSGGPGRLPGRRLLQPAVQAPGVPEPVAVPAPVRQAEAAAAPGRATRLKPAAAVAIMSLPTAAHPPMPSPLRLLPLLLLCLPAPALAGQCAELAPPQLQLRNDNDVYGRADQDQGYTAGAYGAWVSPTLEGDDRHCLSGAMAALDRATAWLRWGEGSQRNLVLDLHHAIYTP